MDATAHPLWMPHALWGLALAAVAAALMIVARDALTRRRLRFTLLVAPGLPGAARRDGRDAVGGGVAPDSRREPGGHAARACRHEHDRDAGLQSLDRGRRTAIARRRSFRTCSSSRSSAASRIAVFGDSIVGPSIGAAAALGARAAGPARQSRSRAWRSRSSGRFASAIGSRSPTTKGASSRSPGARRRSARRPATS